jgi:NADH-quinone oxidoreductase subunit E
MTGVAATEQIEQILSEIKVDGAEKGRRTAYVLPALQRLQRKLGYVPEEAIPRIADLLGVPQSHIYGVATFYAQFRLSPPGRHNITVCCGTACHVRGSMKLLDELRQKLGIGPGETTSDLAYSLDTIACFGSCALAPVVVTDHRVRGRMNRSKLMKALVDLEMESEARGGES